MIWSVLQDFLCPVVVVVVFVVTDFGNDSDGGGDFGDDGDDDPKWWQKVRSPARDGGLVMVMVMVVPARDGGPVGFTRLLTMRTMNNPLIKMMKMSIDEDTDFSCFYFDFEKVQLRR